MKKINNHQKLMIVTALLCLIEAILFIILIQITHSELILIIGAIAFWVPIMINIFLLPHLLSSESNKVVNFGQVTNASIYEKLGKLFIAESLITGIAKKDFIDNNAQKIAKTMGIQKNEIYELYGEINIIHGDYLKKESYKEDNSIGFK